MVKVSAILKGAFCMGWLHGYNKGRFYYGQLRCEYGWFSKSRALCKTIEWLSSVSAPLPPSPPVMIENELQGLLSKADLALGRHYRSIQTLPHPDLFVFMYVRKEVVLSSQIEGTQSSLQDVRDYGLWEDWLVFTFKG